MAVWSEIKASDIVRPSRIDGEYFRPKYLAIRNSLQGHNPLLYYINTVIHPGEFKRIYSLDGVSVLRAQNVRPLSIEVEGNEVFVPDSVASKLPKNRIGYGDILITRTGANFGQTAIFTSERDDAIVTSHTFIVRVKDNIRSAYLALYLNTHYGRELINQGMYGSSQPEIAPKFLKDIPVPRFDDTIENNLSDRVLQAYELRKTSIEKYKEAEELLTQELGLDFSDLESLSNKYISSFAALTTGRRFDSEFYNPKAQKIVERISALTHTKVGINFFVRNGFPWNSKKFLTDNSGEPVIRIRDIKPGYIDNNELTSIVPQYAATINFPKAQPNDLVVGMDGIKYFYSSLVENACLVNQRVCHLIQKPGSTISSEYASFIINSEVGQAQLLRDMTIATTVGHITNANVAKMIIPTISSTFHDQITELVRQSIDAKKECKKLLAESKSKLENLIAESINT